MIIIVVLLGLRRGVVVHTNPRKRTVSAIVRSTLVSPAPPVLTAAAAPRRPPTKVRLTIGKSYLDET